ncbi:alpha/beta hydrolase [Nonomuraea lactucae]|uniref:alpha/beta hydrolase n=1 Tax=Nonomuraea lactucae TaxID=2249762 RepID=UPI000DE42FBB|nr:alpha/beta hydrolase [Nonomuraea lactucae]
MFTFPVDPQAIFDERTAQFLAWGIPKATIAQARTEIRDMWGTAGDGWTPTWARHAEQARSEGRLLRAALCWGAARFPSLATPERRLANQRQLDCYLAAAARFTTRFTREVLRVDGVPVPAHLFQRRRGRPRGVMVLSGGVDTWKMELHRLAVSTALTTGLLVAAIDMPGTGESVQPLGPDSDRVLSGVVDLLRKRHGLPVAFLGLSFGGHWAAKLAMLGQVDAAVCLGGPTGAADERVDVLNLPYGMAGIIGNALGLDSLPGPGLVTELLDKFSLRGQGLLEAEGRAPLLAVNGANDQYIPLGDTTRLAGHPGTTVWIVRDATHCAPEHFKPMIVAIWGWLLGHLGGPLPARALRLPLRPLLTR